MKVKFTIRFGNGAPDELSEGSVFQLLNEIPYLLIDKYILPRVVVNSVLSKGVADSGMSGGCEWKPFELDSSEYDELLKQFRENDFKDVDYPEWVVNRDTWIIHIFELKHGVPHAEHLEIDQKIKEIEKRLNNARDENDEESEGKHMLELMEANDELNELIDKYIGG